MLIILFTIHCGAVQKKNVIFLILNTAAVPCFLCHAFKILETCINKYSHWMSEPDTLRSFQVFICTCCMSLHVVFFLTLFIICHCLFSFSSSHIRLSVCLSCELGIWKTWTFSVLESILKQWLLNTVVHFVCTLTIRFCHDPNMVGQSASQLPSKQLGRVVVTLG